MCFSAAASFTVAGGTGLLATLTASRAANWREAPLAAIPAIFALQQVIEGAIWLDLENRSTAGTGSLAAAFSFIALVVWPLFAPVSTVLVERTRVRQIAIGLLALLGVVESYYGLRNISESPYQVCAIQHTLSYSNGHIYAPAMIAGYLVCTCGAFLLSSFKELRAFGAILALGIATSLAFYFVSFVSVWCFFAAASSIVVYLHFAPRSSRVTNPVSH